MRNTALAIAFSAASFTSFDAVAQYEDNPIKQKLWEVFESTAPYYVTMVECEREITGQLIWDEMDAAASQVVASEQDARIAYNMWEHAREQARQVFSDELALARQNPEGDFCNDIENKVIQELGLTAY